MITKNGIYPDIDIEAYHHDPKLCDGPSISHSGLDRIFKKSPAHYYIGSPLNPTPEPHEPSEAMVLGQSAHHLFLGQDNWSLRYIERPEMILGAKWNGNRLDCKEWLKKQELAGRIVLKPEQIKAVVGMAESLDREPLIRSGILRGKIEQSMIWRDEETGVWLKARPDAIPNDGDYADLKTSIDVSIDYLEKIVGDYGYHRQGALIREGAKVVMGVPPEAFSFTLIFIETKPPYCCTIVALTEEDLDLGHMENRQALKLFKHCLDHNDWPGPAGHQSDARYVAVKDWARNSNLYRRRQIEATLAIAKEQTP